MRYLQRGTTTLLLPSALFPQECCRGRNDADPDTVGGNIVYNAKVVGVR